MQTIHTVGVVGAGVMGRGLSQALAQIGREVVLTDISEDILESALNEIHASVRLGRLFRKPGEELSDAAETKRRIHSTTDIQEFSQAQFVVETVSERPAVKEAVYRDLDRVCRPDCVIASNTSAMPITWLASFTSRPERVIGMHFMNPVPLTTTVEIILGHHTSPETLEAAQDLLRVMNKEGIVVHDSPGFVSNRVLMLAINEAAFVVQEQVAAPESVDEIFRKCLGHKMGPLETADLIGLDTILLSIEVLFDRFKDSKYRPCPLLARMVSAGELGRKTGRGFFNYDPGRIEEEATVRAWSGTNRF